MERALCDSFTNMSVLKWNDRELNFCKASSSAISLNEEAKATGIAVYVAVKAFNVRRFLDRYKIFFVSFGKARV